MPDTSQAAPVYLEDQFEIPAGFRIYKAAPPALTGGSYAMTFDGEGRLLIGDGTAIRRLIDRDGDGVFDSSEVLATGLGWRGPQGLLVYGDRLYAIGGDGLQIYEGYLSGHLKHLGRAGEKMTTGGDHDGHTLLRGWDGYVYFMAGNGSGVEGKKHINVASSPIRSAREASVFRINPTGKEWECISTGGRNPPSLGLNYLGDFFSFDSDMEWHVGLPWYRPVRLNQWFDGGDLGWQEVGAYPPYYLDNISGIVDVGRGSPNWGIFYEHNQFPSEYQDQFFVCDYRKKFETNDEYLSTGQLVAFKLARKGASYSAETTTFARPKANAINKGDGDKPIFFALVDVQVAPDGSLVVSEHNQGIWRITYDPDRKGAKPLSKLPPLNQEQVERKTSARLLMEIPQPLAEYARVAEEKIKVASGENWKHELLALASDGNENLRFRLRAIRLLSTDWKTLPTEFIQKLSTDKSPEVRSLAAWLMNRRMVPDETAILLRLMEDKDTFVRRRAVEAFTRQDTAEANLALVQCLNDPERVIRYLAMTALSHRPSKGWLPNAVDTLTNAQTAMRAVLAAMMRKETPDMHTISATLAVLADPKSNEDFLDALRLATLLQKEVESRPDIKLAVTQRAIADFPNKNKDVAWEQIRFIGTFQIEEGRKPLLDLLETESDPVRQFHIAQQLTKLKRNWPVEDLLRFRKWILSTQQGWFSEFNGKGVEFPIFLLAMIEEAVSQHSAAFLQNETLKQVQVQSLVGTAVLNNLAKLPNAAARLVRLYENQTDAESKIKIARVFGKVKSQSSADFIHQQLQQPNLPKGLEQAFTRSLAEQSYSEKNAELLLKGIGAEDLETSKSSAAVLFKYAKPGDGKLAKALISRMEVNPAQIGQFESMLKEFARVEPPAIAKDLPDQEKRNQALEFWKKWYQQNYGEEFSSVFRSARPERSDEVVHAVIMKSSFAGDRMAGRRLYERLQCNQCHGGGETPGQEGRIFGPELPGVVQRLTRAELADALVYPSKQVPERYKAQVVELQDEREVTGFITEKTETTLTVVTQTDVQKLPVTEVKSIALQKESLMPAKLLNSLSDAELENLLTFLSKMGTR